MARTIAENMWHSGQILDIHCTINQCRMSPNGKTKMSAKNKGEIGSHVLSSIEQEQKYGKYGKRKENHDFL